ncbi:MAG TPA: hypothetical protein VJS64_08595 [Pyrinomonadaceae bacterium]|nr:hypothetical protein [Pyrinomonadaceae bacterium]
MIIRSLKLPFLLVLVVTFSISSLEAGQRSAWRTYKGAWFEIRYPANFKARPSLKSISFDGQYDSAVFTAADGSAEFYVFAPQWNGKPSDIEIDSLKEEYVSQRSEKKGTVIVRRVTIKAKDGSYTRAFEDTENTDLNIRRVFGFKYRNRATYNKYRNQYLNFKRSLQQFSD